MEPSLLNYAQIIVGHYQLDMVPLIPAWIGVLPVETIAYCL
jgi:hypothetical protein